jgi:hypothetical protein
MEEFEKQFDDMEVITMTMEGTMDASTTSLTPAEDVDSLIREVLLFLTSFKLHAWHVL